MKNIATCAKEGLLTGLLLVLLLSAGNSCQAYAIPGVDEPYDPANYYSRESISYADSRPSLFALWELSRGDVYDYTRHLKSILFGDKFEGWLASLIDENLRQVLDMLGLGDKGATILAGMQKSEKADFGIPDWAKAEGLLLNDGSTWLRTGSEGMEKYSWLAKVYQEGIAGARANQEDMEESVANLNAALANSQEAEGNMAVHQSQAELEALLGSETARRNKLLANQAVVVSAGARLKLDEDRRAMLAEDRVMTLKIVDRKNPTEQDKTVRVPTGAGFKDF